MKIEEYIKETSEFLINAMKDGNAPWRQEWSAGTYNLPYNPTTSRAYQGINSLRLQMAQRKDPRWLTYKQAANIGAQVRKGEKSLAIQYTQYTMLIDEVDENKNLVFDENGKVRKKEIYLKQPRVYWARVFNADQIDNMPKLESKPKLTTFSENAEFEKIISNSKANIEFGHNMAAYQKKLDKIVMPNKNEFESEKGYYATIFHEMGHWSGHESRLNRDLSGPFGSANYAKEELRAEIASYMICSRFDLDYNPSNNIAYLDSWAAGLKDKPEEIFQATTDATNIVKFIEGFGADLKQEISQENQNESANLAKEKTYLSVPYAEKNEAKKFGVKWDKDAKLWYAPVGVDLNKLERWRTNTNDIPAEKGKSIDPVADFKEFLQKQGLIIDGDPIMDGKMKRVPVNGDKGRKTSGAYVGFLDGCPAGWAKNYKENIESKWKSSFVPNSNNISSNIEAKSISNAKKIKENEIALEKSYLNTALMAQNEFKEAKWANSNHPYLKNKGFEENFYLKQDKFGNLLIPLKDTNGKHWASQRIFSNGEKMIGMMRTKEEKEQNITYPAKKQGNFFLLGAKNLDFQKEAYVVEGFATAASIFKATNKPVIMAVDIGNMGIVVDSILKKYTNINLTIAADNDISKELKGSKNVGKDAAFKIQEKNNAINVVLPNFNQEEVIKGCSDFNDLMNSRGVAAVAKQLANVKQAVCKYKTSEEIKAVKDFSEGKKVNYTRQKEVKRSARRTM